MIFMEQGRKRRGNPYVVIPGGPGGVELHVELPLFPGQLVVLGLLLAGQRVPLQENMKVMLERCFT